MPDCSAFVTRLRQTLKRLFPVNMEKREPISKYNACLAIHDLLCKLWDMPLRLRKTSFLQAWHDRSSKVNQSMCRICSQLSVHLLQTQPLIVLTICQSSASSDKRHR
jgi:hypothetical protein